jgi:NADH-quinone oxidoreductase subunit N
MSAILSSLPALAEAQAAIDTPTLRFSAIAPELVMLGTAAFLLLLTCFVRGRLERDLSFLLGAGAFIGAAVAAGIIWDYGGGDWLVFAEQLQVDRFGNLVRIIICGAGLITLLASVGWRTANERPAEFVALLLVASAGMSLLAVSNTFMALFVSFELFSITLYLLCALDARDRASLESGLKYLIIGSVGSAVLLYGMAFLYGATGSLYFDEVSAVLGEGEYDEALALIGAAMLIAGLAFKIAAVPFHMWSPDVYEGAPTPITGFMSAATKAAAFTILLRVLVEALPSQDQYWEPALAVIAIASMVLGNLAALAQRNLKRMLAYSSIGHAGYLLIALIAGGDLSHRALLFYLAVYSATSLGAFAIIAVRERETGTPATLDSIRGWGFSRPLLGVLFAIFLLSLAGFPPTGGFLAKLYVFGGAVDQGHTYLAIVGVATSVLALGYYLRVLLAVYDRRAESHAMLPAGPGLVSATIGAVLAAIVVMWLGIYPADALDWAREAAGTLAAAP